MTIKVNRINYYSLLLDVYTKRTDTCKQQVEKNANEEVPADDLIKIKNNNKNI